MKEIQFPARRAAHFTMIQSALRTDEDPFGLQASIEPSGRTTATDPWHGPTHEERRRRDQARPRKSSRKALRKRALTGLGMVLLGGSAGIAWKHHQIPNAMALPRQEAVAREEFKIRSSTTSWPTISDYLSAQGVKMAQQQRRGNEIFATVELPSWATGRNQSWMQLRLVASSLEEAANGDDLPPALPPSVNSELASSKVKLTRQAGDYQLESGGKVYGSLEGFVDKDFSASATRRQPMSAREKTMGQSSASTPTVITVGKQAIEGLVRFCSGGILAASPDLESLSLTYDPHRHQGIVWLTGAVVNSSGSNLKESAKQSDLVWSQLPQSRMSLVSQSGFLGSLLLVHDPALKASLFGHLWANGETAVGPAAHAWQGLSLQAPLQNLAQLAGLASHSRVATAWAAQSTMAPSLAEGQHQGWSLARPSAGVVVVKSGFENETAAAPSPRTMWGPKKLPGTPRALGRFDVPVPQETGKAPALSTISWAAGGNGKQVWICFQDQSAPDPDAKGACPVLEPEVKSIHRISPTILVGQ